LLAAATSAAALAVAGCGADSAEDASGPVTIEVWTVIDPESATDPRGAAFKQQVEQFESDHPDIKVNVTLFPFAKVAEELIRAEGTGEGPDVVDVYDPVIPMHVGAGSLLPITEYVEEWLAQNGDDYIFPADPLKGGSDDYHALAYEMRAQVFWYRADLLDQAGVAVPTSLAEVAQASGELSKLPGGPSGYGFGLSTDLAGSDLIEKYLPLLWGFGGEYIDEEGKAVFNSQAGVDAINWLVSVKDAGGYGEGALRTNSDDVLAGVRAGTVVTTVGGTQRVGAARTGEGVGENLVTMPIPGAEPGSVFPTLVEGWCYGIGANSKHPDEAWEFIKAKLTSESQAISAAAGVLPILGSSYEGADAELQEWAAYIEEHGRSVNYPVDWSELNTDFDAEVQKMVFQGAPVKETLDAFVERYNAEHGN
jgi:multiple sugar transport system substrate-binding protein